MITSRRAGRPSLYRHEFARLAWAFIIDGGGSLARFAATLGCSPDCVYGWQEKHPEFANAIARARRERDLINLDLAGYSRRGKRILARTQRDRYGHRQRQGRRARVGFT